MTKSSKFKLFFPLCEGKLGRPDSGLHYFGCMAVAVLRNMKAGDNCLALNQADSGTHISPAISNQRCSLGCATATPVVSVSLV